MKATILEIGNARRLLAGALWIAVLACLGGSVSPAAAQSCPETFSSAHYDLRLNVPGPGYFRQISDGVYCQVHPNPSGGYAKRWGHRLLVRESGSSFVLYTTRGIDGSSVRTPFLHIRIENSNCGTTNDLFGQPQTKVCIVSSRRSGDRWVRPTRWWGYFRQAGWSRNHAPYQPSGLMPANNVATGSSTTLRWRNNGDMDGDRVSFYVVVWILDGGGWRQIRSAPVNGTSYRLSNLPRGSYVYWRLWAADGSQWSRNVDASFRVG